MAKHITALVLILASLAFLFLAPGAKQEAPDVPASSGSGTVSSEDSSSKINKILEDNKVPAEESSGENSTEETDAE